MAPSLREDLLDLVVAHDVVQLPEVEVVGLEQPQALLEQAQRPVARAVVGLAREEHFLAPRRHDLADEGLADAVELPSLPGGVARAAVGGGRVDVVHAQVDRAVDDGNRHVVLVGLFERRLAAQAEEAHLVARASESPFGHGRRGGVEPGRHGQGGGAGDTEFHEFTSSQIVSHLHTP